MFTVFKAQPGVGGQRRSPFSFQQLSGELAQEVPASTVEEGLHLSKEMVSGPPHTDLSTCCLIERLHNMVAGLPQSERSKTGRDTVILLQPSLRRDRAPPLLHNTNSGKSGPTCSSHPRGGG